tara:strand:+ start:1439 stop:2395 length:957 start_codon:yes stop_codon:yes gene_type:complete
MSELGLAIDGFTPATDIAGQAKAAEEGGAQTLWIATHLFQRDPVALASAALAATKTLKVALMAVSPFSVHPVYAAMSAATLDELFPGRVVLSLGVGAPNDLKGAGIESDRPLLTIREATEICREMFAGDAVHFEGEKFRISGRRLVNGAREIPIFLAASGPRMLALGGTHADGAIVSGATAAPFVKTCLKRVTAGAGGRSIRNYGIVYTCIDPDQDKAIAPVRRTLAFILRGEHHATNIEMGGSALDQDQLRQAFSAQDWDELEKIIGPEVAGAHAACGDAAYVRNRLSEYFSAGLDQVIISGIADPDEIRSTLRALL